MRRRAQSASSLKTLKQCELKYWFRYEERLPSLVGEAEYLPFGTSVHRGLEELYKLHMERFGTDYRFSDEDFDHVYNIFMKTAVEEKLTDIELLTEGWNMIKDRMVAFDYSEEVLAVEYAFDMEVGEDGVRARGLIDKVIKLDDTTIAVLDYKTSKMALTDAEASTDIQLSLYDLVASVTWPEYENIVLVLDYLRLNPVMSFRTKASRKLFSSWLKETDKYVVSRKKEDIKPTINTFCGTCESRYSCEAFQNVQKDFLTADFLIDGLSDEEMVEQWDKFDNLFKAVNAKRRSMSMQLDKAIRKKDGGTIKGSTKKLYKVQGSRISYSVEDLVEWMSAEEILKICSVNKKALDRFLASRPDIAEKVRKLGNVTYNRPSFNISNK